jgi:hypothetical protein
VLISSVGLTLQVSTSAASLTIGTPDHSSSQVQCKTPATLADVVDFEISNRVWSVELPAACRCVIGSATSLHWPMHLAPEGSYSPAITFIAAFGDCYRSTVQMPGPCRQQVNRHV